VSMINTVSTDSAALNTNTSAHALDNVIWSALTSQHSSIAQGDELARRYPVEIARFAAMRDTSAESFASLTRLPLIAGDQLALFTVDELVGELAPPDQFEIVLKKSLEQMVGPTTRGSVDRSLIESLGAADADDMMALVELTKPGPFSIRTHELGSYLGIRDNGKLVAMVGERMRLDGHTEISAVCAHPDYRGRGYPYALIGALSNAILDRGDVPFLHVFSDNQSAIALYEKLGFTFRKTLQLTILSTVN
jgi:ribosomal protein S18 acetylase RimI-like enzyme